MRDFRCCDKTWQTMHDLLQHYEENHHGQPNMQISNPMGGFERKLQTGFPIADPPRSNARSMQPNASSGANQNGISGMGMQMSGQLGQQNRQFGGMSGSNGMNMGGISSMMRSQPGTPNQGQSQLSMNDDLDAVGDMEMDDMMDVDDNQRTMQQTRQMFGQQQRPSLSLNSSGLGGFNQQALRTSTPTTPGAAGFGFQNNPTVSSVNTPTMGAQTFRGQFQDSSNATTPTNELMDEDFSGMPKMNALGQLNMNLNGLGGLDVAQFGLGGFGNGNGNNMNNFGTISDPGKQLFAPGGGNSMMTPEQQNITQQFAQFGIDVSSLPAGTDLQALLQQLSPLAIQEEHKPFKCPVIGCEKAYKNQNGLKYHKTHGHSTQQLHENGDGTFSIVNPETSQPFPGTLGMEKEKPFKCDVCGKRYKNLNGLKYVSYLFALISTCEYFPSNNIHSTKHTLLRVILMLLHVNKMPWQHWLPLVAIRCQWV